MLKIDSSFVQKILSAEKAEDLHELLQNAIELEHSTIPPYLTAMFSLKPQSNREIWYVIHSVVIEEMLHMTIACNVLNALGGAPAINKPDFIPNYPGPLPMNIGDGLIVGLEPYSKAVVKNTFMAIEEPEDPIEFPVVPLMAAAAPDFATIGQFYHALQEKIAKLPHDQLPGDPSRQVVDNNMFSPEELFPIITKQNAIDALDIIVEQGEGTATSPLDPEGDYAHYYRFEELYYGRRLVKDTSVPQGYSFSGDPIPINESDIYPVAANTKSADLPEHTEQRRQADQFNFIYGKLLNGLHRTFNGEPAFLGNTIGLMYDLKLTGETLAAMEYPGKTGVNVGPPFEYVNLNQ